ncbi:hypothetical protein SCA6_008077 [Theobroma cacao]
MEMSGNLRVAATLSSYHQHHPFRSSILSSKQQLQQHVALVLQVEPNISTTRASNCKLGYPEVTVAAAYGGNGMVFGSSYTLVVDFMGSMKGGSSFSEISLKWNGITINS